MITKRSIEELAIIVFSTALAAIVAYLIGIFPETSQLLAEFFVVISIAFLVIITLFSPLSKAKWIISMKWRLRNPIIGILEEPNCSPASSSMTARDWKDKFQQLSLKTELISACKISDKYSAIINPYGEAYPEESLLELKTLGRIKGYMENGGIFVSAGGLAFFYAADIHSSPPRNVPIAEELVLYSPTQAGSGLPQGSLQPVQSYPPLYSLTDTLLHKNFGVVTTWRGTENDQCFQQGNDRAFVGDLVNQGGTDRVLHFRAVREPIRKCIPFLRVQPANWQGDVYVIAGVPYGRGCLVLNSFDLRDNTAGVVHNSWTPALHRANSDKICLAIKNLINNRKSGQINLSAENW